MNIFLTNDDGIYAPGLAALHAQLTIENNVDVIAPDREQSAVEFYRLLSSFDFMSSTPTLFNSGTLRPQLSSCYLTTVPDHLDGIFSSIKDDALLSKYAGGLGNDWTRVRGMGAHIKGTNGKSQGVVPFMKVANDTAVAVNQGGKRKGAVCAYLETWHIDIEDFLDLRKNTGDDRRRTHDMNTANWIPDLFMERVEKDWQWSLFDPKKVPHLTDLFGEDFERAYLAAEEARYENGLSTTYQVLEFQKDLAEALSTQRAARAAYAKALAKLRHVEGAIVGPPRAMSQGGAGGERARIVEENPE